MWLQGVATALFVCLAGSSALFAQTGPVSAWERLVRRNPTVVEDDSVSWRERLVLHALTPEQAELYFSGRADADSLRLGDGRTLAEYLAEKLTPPAQVFIPLAGPCPFFSLTVDADFSEARTLSTRSADSGGQGLADGCGIPVEASAVLVRATVHSLGGVPARLKLWAADGPEPACGPEREETLLDDWPLAYETTLLAPLCGGCPEKGIGLRTGRPARVSATALGYFRPLTARDAPGGGILLSTESASNNFFGTAAGAFNTTGFDNSFFGASSGAANTTGVGNSFFGGFSGSLSATADANSFFGYEAGYLNTTGGNNSFFGSFAGFSNTTETGNTFIGASSNGAASITNATAVGYRAQVSQSNSLVLGSVNGLNGAASDVKVGLGTDKPHFALHVKRTDGTAKIVAEEASATTASRSLFELQNNGAAFFNLRNTNLNKVWSFSVSGIGAFQIDDPSVAGGAEMTLVSSGTVRIGPGGTQNFLLDPSGNLTIKGGLTANGVFYPSDRDLKENVVPIDSDDLLDRVARLPISSWSYKTDPGTQHVGPMAQDFQEAFGIGSDGHSINAMDAAGVTLAAVQGLNKRVRGQAVELERQRVEIDAQREVNRSLRGEIKALRDQIEALHRLLARQASEGR